jgi:hypothetical protein
LGVAQHGFDVSGVEGGDRAAYQSFAWRSFAPERPAKGISYLRLLVTRAQHRPQSVNAYSA